VCSNNSCVSLNITGVCYYYKEQNSTEWKDHTFLKHKVNEKTQMRKLLLTGQFCINMYTHMHTYTCMHACTQTTYTHAHAHLCVCTPACTCAREKTHTHIPLTHKCVTKAIGCRTSHKYTYLHNFYSIKYYKHFIEQYYRSASQIKN
jgi:hypothetical protein